MNVNGVSESNYGYATWLMMTVTRLVGAVKPTLYDQSMSKETSRQFAGMYLDAVRELTTNPEVVKSAFRVITRGADDNNERRAQALIEDLVGRTSEDKPVNWALIADIINRGYEIVNNGSQSEETQT